MNSNNCDENYEEQSTFDGNLSKFANKTLILRSIDSLNEKCLNEFLQPTFGKGRNIRRIVKQSTEIYEQQPQSIKKQLSLDQDLIGKVIDHLNLSSQPLNSIKCTRKKLTVQKNLKNGDLLDGQGVARLSFGETIFAYWKDGDTDGEVKIIYPSGNIYIGTAKNHIRHGYGTLIFKSGSKFEGKFNMGKIDGYGVLKDQYGEIVMKGYWKAGYFVHETK